MSTFFIKESVEEQSVDEKYEKYIKQLNNLILEIKKIKQTEKEFEKDNGIMVFHSLNHFLNDFTIDIVADFIKHLNNLDSENLINSTKNIFLILISFNFPLNNIKKYYKQTNNHFFLRGFRINIDHQLYTKIYKYYIIGYLIEKSINYLLTEQVDIKNKYIQKIEKDICVYSSYMNEIGSKNNYRIDNLLNKPYLWASSSQSQAILHVFDRKRKNIINNFQPVLFELKIIKNNNILISNDKDNIKLQQILSEKFKNVFSKIKFNTKNLNNVNFLDNLKCENNYKIILLCEIINIFNNINLIGYYNYYDQNEIGLISKYVTIEKMYEYKNIIINGNITINFPDKEGKLNKYYSNVESDKIVSYIKDSYIEDTYFNFMGVIKPLFISFKNESLKSLVFDSIRSKPSDYKKITFNDDVYKFKYLKYKLKYINLYKNKLLNNYNE
jgi:hypothetical protein